MRYFCVILRFLLVFVSGTNTLTRTISHISLTEIQKKHPKHSIDAFSHPEEDYCRGFVSQFMNFSENQLIERGQNVPLIALNNCTQKGPHTKKWKFGSGPSSQ